MTQKVKGLAKGHTTRWTLEAPFSGEFQLIALKIVSTAFFELFCITLKLRLFLRVQAPGAKKSKDSFEILSIVCNQILHWMPEIRSKK